MKNLKSHFAFNRSQRNGIFLLLTVILGLLLVLFFYPFQHEITRVTKEEKESILVFQNKIDSLKKEEKAENKPKIYPFNPNFITDYKGYTLGMSIEEIDRLHQFRKEDQWVNSIEDFQRVTKISDSLLAKISPYFKFPEWVTHPKTSSYSYENYKRKEDTNELPFRLKKDLNTATAEELMEIRGIGEKLSHRIIRYRTQIGGFVNDLQLKDIYGLDDEVTQRLTNKFTVKDTTAVKKININTADLAELSEIVYFDYELARDIVEYRTLHEGISSFEELAKIDGFPAYQIERIQLYLTLQ